MALWLIRAVSAQALLVELRLALALVGAALGMAEKAVFCLRNFAFSVFAKLKGLFWVT
jgi:hypothetical protein